MEGSVSEWNLHENSTLKEVSNRVVCVRDGQHIDI